MPLSKKVLTSNQQEFKILFTADEPAEEEEVEKEIQEPEARVCEETKHGDLLCVNSYYLPYA